MKFTSLSKKKKNSFYNSFDVNYCNTDMSLKQRMQINTEEQITLLTIIKHRKLTCCNKILWVLVTVWSSIPSWLPARSPLDTTRSSCIPSFPLTEEDSLLSVSKSTSELDQEKQKDRREMAFFLFLGRVFFASLIIVSAWQMYVLLLFLFLQRKLLRATRSNIWNWEPLVGSFELVWS